MEKVIAGLIKGRHEMPVNAYIFEDAIADVFNFDAIRKHIITWISGNVGVVSRDFQHGINQASDDDVRCFVGEKSLTVYVTGLTLVTAELIRVCAYLGVRLTLMHYNSATGDYESQCIF